MESFFAQDWTGPEFAWFGTAHLTALLLVVLLNVALTWRLQNAPKKSKRTIAIVMAAILWANELAWHLWNGFTGQWTIQTMLPLHACSLLVWTGALMLITGNYHIYEFCYFLGIGGAMQALLTPDLGIYGFPHFRFFQTFLSHGLIITAAIYMTLVYGLRPTWKSLARVGTTLLVYLVIVFFVNQWIGSNYLFIAYKPPTGSLLDILPEWPVYIFYMILIGLAVFLLLYLPFAIKDWAAIRRERARAAM
ncbi:MAG: TIGR02206 family membrane protein [Anaerolineales bacterium]|nr:TIGR02206 family membrane protein [Anaerolineales bacterium]